MMRSLDRTTKALVLVASAALAAASGCVSEPEESVALGVASSADQQATQSTFAPSLPMPSQGTTAPPMQPLPPIGQPIGQQQTGALPPIGQQPAGQQPVGQQPVGQQPVEQQPVAQAPVAQQPEQAPAQQTPVQQAPVQQTPVQAPVVGVGGCAPVGVPIGCAGPTCWGARRGFFDDSAWSLPGGFLYGGNPLLGPLFAFPAFAAGFFGPFNCIN